jgi:hypothetical protein
MKQVLEIIVFFLLGAMIGALIIGAVASAVS